MNQFTTIREALQHSFFIGVHSDLPWFTNLQHRALRALDAIEGRPILSEVGDNGQTPTPTVDTTHTACPWPPGECED